MKEGYGYGNYTYNRVLGTDKKCPICKKEYHIASWVTDWRWRANGRLVCSYSCMMKWKRAEEAKEEARKREKEARKEELKRQNKDVEPKSRVTPREREKIMRLRKIGLTYAMIAEVCGRSSSTVKDVIDKEIANGNG